MRHNSKLLVGMVLAVAASGAWAGSTWSFADYKNSASVGGVNVTTSAYYLKNNANASNAFYSTGSNGQVKTATRGTNDVGLGVLSDGESGSPNHAVDNRDRTDMILFSFSSVVELDSVKLGWTANSSGSTSSDSRDADFSVLRYKWDELPAGQGGKDYTIAGKTWAQLMSDGWEMVSNVDGKNATSYDVNGQGKTSSWWIVSAFNTGYGGGANGGDNNDDYFKLASLTGTVHTPSTPGEVPEPASLALMGLGLFGVLAVRRRVQQRQG